MSKVPTLQQLTEKAERTAAAASAVIKAERLAREQKTARLRALRLAKEAVEKSRPEQGRAGSR